MVATTPERDDEVAVRLRDFLAAELPRARDLEITGLRRISSGFSRENWPFDASWHEHDQIVHRALIMRRDPVGSVLETDRRTEFAVLRTLERTDLPVPRALWLDAEGAWLGRPTVVMERYEGVCDWFVLNGGESQLPEDRRLDLAHEYLALLGRIHGVDWRTLGMDTFLRDPGLAGATAAVDEWEAELRRQALEPQPELELVLAWLRANQPPAADTVLVHGDFKPGNSLLRDGEIVVVLDWETAHLGDPMEDVGWITNPLRRGEHQIPGKWERADILAAYESLTGRHVDEAAVHFWNVFANFKLSVIVLTGARSFVEGRGDRVHGHLTALIALMFDMIGV